MEDHTATITLRRVAPAWAWARKNFSLASVLTIAGIIATAGGYIISLRTRIVVVEHEVHDIKEVVPNAGSLARLEATVQSHESRITRLENDWDDAARTAATAAPRPNRRSRP